jgi:glycine/D-amino acid oxidase-like deaminating enzyme
VVVIGGGLAGTATAFFLATAGLGVRLLEAGDLNTQASGANAGSIHLQIPVAEYRGLGRAWAETFAPTLALLKAGAERWATLDRLLGRDVEFKQSGGVIVARTAAEMAVVEEKARLEEAHGVAMELLDRAALRDRFGYIADTMIGGAFCAGEGKANPLLATRAFAAAAAKAGAVLERHAPVTGLGRDGDGYEIATADGRRFRSRRVVNCAGAAAGDVAAMVGIRLNIRGYPIQVTATEPTGPLIPHLVYTAAGKLTVKQMANGTCLIGGGWPSRHRADGGLAVNAESLRANMATAIDTIPALGALRTVRTWPAIVNGTDDWRPLIGEVPGHPGFYLNLFPWMGFTGGPIAAEIVAAQIAGLPLPTDSLPLPDLAAA